MPEPEQLIAEDYRSNQYPPWGPRFWNGMRLPEFARLVANNRFQVSPFRYPMLFMVGGCSVFNSALSQLQSLIHGSSIRNTTLEKPPIFIIGHWRSGTTLVHELMSCDSSLAFPNNFDTFVPHHFLVSQPFFHPLMRLLMPGKRPMDNMSMGPDSPQEDDFALCSMGAPTPYYRIAFPNRMTNDHYQLDAENLTVAQTENLKTSLDRFYAALTVKYKRRLVLKSPPHTGRIAKLAEWFPNAKFVHISRHPYQVVPSTLRLWQTLDQIHGLQIPKYDDRWLVDYICECKDLMYGAFRRDRTKLQPNQIAELTFEDLVANPVEQMQNVYEKLELDGFESTQPAIERYFQNRSGHKKNANKLSRPLKALIDEQWKDYCDWFGYKTDER